MGHMRRTGQKGRMGRIGYMRHTGQKGTDGTNRTHEADGTGKGRGM